MPKHQRSGRQKSRDEPCAQNLSRLSRALPLSDAAKLSESRVKPLLISNLAFLTLTKYLTVA